MLVYFEALDSLNFPHAGAVPAPAAVFGALKAHLLRHSGFDPAAYRAVGRRADLEGILAVTGSRWQRGSLKIYGPFLSLNEQVLVTAPHGLVVTDRGIATLSPLAFDSFDWDMPQKLSPVWVSGCDEVSSLSGYVTLEGLKSYLAQGRLETEYYFETKRLYRAVENEAFVRLCPGVRLACWVEGIEDVSALDGVLLPLGGRRRHVVLSSVPAERPRCEIELGKRFKLVLLTPSVFKHGWRPSWLGEDGCMRLAGIEAQLVSYICRGPQYLSGWDMTHSQPRRTRAAVPAGSEYLFELRTGSLEELKKLFHFQAVSDRQPWAGHGVSVLGNWRCQ